MPPRPTAADFDQDLLILFETVHVVLTGKGAR